VLHLIWRALQQCPDEYPPPSTTGLGFISDSTLRESIRLDIGAATRALQNSGWKAATVLGGATIEALLHWKLDQPPITAAQRVAAGKSAVGPDRLQSPLPSDFDRWRLRDFIEVAGELKVIKAETVKAANLARDFRNLIHPGAAARKAAMCDRLFRHRRHGKRDPRFGVLACRGLRRLSIVHLKQPAGQAIALGPSAPWVLDSGPYQV